MLKFEPGKIYNVNYGSFTKLATFLYSENGNNVFFDNNGEFVFSDKFLAKGSVKIEEIAED